MNTKRNAKGLTEAIINGLLSGKYKNGAELSYGLKEQFENYPIQKIQKAIAFVTWNIRKFSGYRWDQKNFRLTKNGR